MTIRADAEQLWNMVADVTRMGEWSPETERAEWLDGTSGPSVGARFRGYNRRGRTKWSTVCQVIEAEPGRAFAFSVGNPVKPVGDEVEVAESFELVKPLGFFSRLLTRVTTGVREREADLTEGARTTLASLKRLAEAT